MIRMPANRGMAARITPPKRIAARSGRSGPRSWRSITAMRITRSPGVWPVVDQKKAK